MIYMSFNEDSKQRIRNIENGFRNNPTYSAYSINNYCYDMYNTRALEVTRNGQMINLFLFYPSFDGKISSIALYGLYLQDHYNAMKKSMMCFGMKISEISMEYGKSEYVDIYLDY